MDSEQRNDLASPTCSTAHMNPEWLKGLKSQFQSRVIDKCSSRVREAVKNNEKIVDIRKVKEVRASIIGEVVTSLLEIFGGVGRPGVAEVRQLVSEMGFHYPAMFKDDLGVMGYGLGGSKGVSGLANQILDAFRRRENDFKKKPVTEGDPIAEERETKKGKKKLVYGCRKCN